MTFDLEQRSARLRAFRNQNRAEQRPKVRNAADQSTADLYLYDEIGPFGITAADFAQTLAAIGDVDVIRLFINSPGGDVFDGIAILNLLRRQKARIDVTVDGLAASAASFIAMAGDTITMSRNAEVMVHRAWGVAVGNANDLRELADMLAAQDDNLARIYADRAGGDPASWLQLMDAETWFSDEEAVKVGLADRVDGAKDGAAAKARFDLSMFAHAGRADAPAPLRPAALAAPHAPGSEPDKENHREETAMADTLKAAILERLGVNTELDDDGVLAALDEVLQEQAGDDNPKPDEGSETNHDNTDGEQPGATVATAYVDLVPRIQEPEVPEGTVLVDKVAFEQLKAAAERGEKAEQEAVAQRRDGIIAQAMSEGRITPATKAKFRALLDSDEDAAVELIGSLQPVANLTERGDARDDVESDPENALYAKWAGHTTKEN